MQSSHDANHGFALAHNDSVDSGPEDRLFRQCRDGFSGVCGLFLSALQAGLWSPERGDFHLAGAGRESAGNIPAGPEIGLQGKAERGRKRMALMVSAFKHKESQCF